MNYNRCKGLEFIARVMKIVAVTAGMPVDLLFPSVRNQILVNLIGFCHAQPQLNYILTQTNAEVSTIYTFSIHPTTHTPGTVDSTLHYFMTIQDNTTQYLCKVGNLQLSRPLTFSNEFKFIFKTGNGIIFPASSSLIKPLLFLT